MLEIIRHIFHVFLNWSGSSNPSGNQYGFWSGFGSDLGEIAILGSIVGLYKHHNCAVKGCVRIAHHPVRGTNLKTCHKHATVAIHNKIRKEHKENYPDQHELLNK